MAGALFPKEIEKELTIEFLTIFREEYFKVFRKQSLNDVAKRGLDVGTVGFDKAFKEACRKDGRVKLFNYYGDEKTDTEVFGIEVEVLMREARILPVSSPYNGAQMAAQIGVKESDIQRCGKCESWYFVWQLYGGKCESCDG